MLRFAKRSAFWTLEAAGVNTRNLRSHAHDLLVLAYHGVLSEPKKAPFSYHHTEREFRLHMEWAGRHCTPIDLDDLERWLGGWTPAKPPVLVTFDDGLRNNATVAAPVLQKAGIPAVFFLSTGYIGAAQVLWPEEVFLRTMRWPGGRIQNPAGEMMSVPADDAERARFGHQMTAAVKDAPDASRLSFLEYLRAGTEDVDLRVDPEAQEFLTWDDVRALAARGFEIGSHTVTHPILSRVEPFKLRSELTDSRTEIEARIGRTCRAIAYPNGRSQDIGPDSVSAAEQAGYQFAFAASGRWQKRRGGRFLIDRVQPPKRCDSLSFSYWMSGTKLEAQAR